MCVLPILGDVTLELVSEAVGALQDGDLTCHPERAAQSGIAVYGQFGLSTERGRLDGCKVHPAELQELAVMLKAAKITSFGQDGQRIDWPDPRDGHEQFIVDVVFEKFDSAILNLIVLRNQAASFAQHQTKHSGRIGVPRNWQAHRGLGRLINICEQFFFETSLPTTCQASAIGASWPMAEIKCGEDTTEKPEAWRKDFNEERPHSAIGNKVPAALMKLPDATRPSV